VGGVRRSPEAEAALAAVRARGVQQSQASPVLHAQAFFAADGPS
jgi:hypothetical protein